MKNLKRILLVDDDEIHLAIAANILEEKYQIFIAKSGKETLDLLLKGISPHLILLDILMPNMDGWQTFHSIKGISLLKDVPIAFFTSVQGENEMVNAKRIGASDYITKPYDKDDLLKRIEIILENQEKP